MAYVFKHNLHAYKVCLHETYLYVDYIGRYDSITADQTTATGRRLVKFMLEDAQ